MIYLSTARNTLLPIEHQAKILADWLTRHLSFPYEKRGIDAASSVVYRDPPNRSELAFQTKSGEAAMKVKLSDTLSEASCKEIYCLGHGEFTIKPGTDQEHADPYASIRNKQRQFINYLRGTPRLAQALLKIEGMDNYFRMGQESTREQKEREQAGSPVSSGPPVLMGTRLFYLLCYNDQNNIWLLCHGCNISKGEQETLNWFSQHPRFGAPFVKAIESSGGLQKGFLVDKIFSPSVADYILEIGGAQFRIPPSTTSIFGVGEFVVNWFCETHGYDYQINKTFYEKVYGLIKGKLQQIRDLLNLSDDRKARRKIKDLSTAVREITGILQHSLLQIEKARNSLSDEDSGSPDSSTSDRIHDEQMNKAISDAKARWNNTYNEIAIWRIIKRAYPTKHTTTSLTSAINSPASSNQFVSELLLLTPSLLSLPAAQVQHTKVKVKALLDKEASIPAEDDFKKIFLELIKSPDTIAQEKAIEADRRAVQENEQRVAAERAGETYRREAENERAEKEAERERRAQAEQRAEMERSEKEAERAEKEAERERREEAEREVLRLRALLSERGASASSVSSRISFLNRRSSLQSNDEQSISRKRTLNEGDYMGLSADAQPESPIGKRSRSAREESAEVDSQLSPVSGGI